MVTVGPGYIWHRGGSTFIGEFFLSRGEEAFELCEKHPFTATHQRRDTILTRMLKW